MHTAYVRCGMHDPIDFEWDPAKDLRNPKKHRVSFDEAATAFYDERGFLLDDPDHSDTEDRFVLIGMSSALRVLVIVQAFRGSDSLIRIISARRAMPSERDFYRRRLGQ